MNIITAADEIYERAVQMHMAGRLAEAEALYRQVLARQPNNGNALFGLGTIAHQCGRNETAVQIFQHAAQFVTRAALYNNMGEAYRALGRAVESEATFRKAMEIKPRDPMPYNNLGIVLCLLGRLREAEDVWRKAIALKPDYADALNNLGNAMLEQGEAEEAARLHRQTLQIQPVFPRAHSNLLRDLNHIEPYDPVKLRAEHAAWWRQQAPGITPRNGWNTTRDPDRPLRVGLMSADFREHSVAYFLEPWLSRRDRGQIKIWCYAELASADDVTKRLHGMVDGWRSTMGVSDAAVSEQIFADQIDILIDLAGHTASNRLAVLAHRPAPVQVSFLGYPFTTGAPTVDWRITDVTADPLGMTEIAYTERLWRLPRSAWCYRPMAGAPEVAPLPAEKNGYVTFGSFNTLAKVSHRVIETWATILQRVPRARFLLKANALGDEGVRRRVAEHFTRLGVAPERLTMMGRLLDGREHLGVYSQVDIALDTFPYNGTTTTCEALWMGVPVVGVVGKMHIERVGASLLGTVGLQDLLAADVAGYVAIAEELAGDLPRVAELRRTMRERLRGSALTDEAGYARDFDAALRGMWREWCGR